MSKDVFISYSSKEIVTAIMIRDKLEKDGITCWMAPDSIAPGLDYMREIPRAIDECKVFLLLLSESAQKSPWVKKEMAMAVSKEKDVIPFIISPCEISEEFGFALANAQRWDAYDSMKSSLSRLVTRIQDSTEDFQENSNTTELSNTPKKENTGENGIKKNQAISSTTSNEDKIKKKLILLIIIFITILGIVSLLLINLLKNKAPKQDIGVSTESEMNKEEIQMSTLTPCPELKPSPTSKPTPTSMPTLTPTIVPTPTPTVVPTPTSKPTLTVTPSPTVAPTLTVTPTPTSKPTPTIAPTPTVTPTPTSEAYTFSYIALADQTVIITGIHSGNASKMIIPEKIDGKTVVEIGPNAFENCTTFKHVEIPSTVTIINDFAFNHCKSLNEIHIPGNVTKIGLCAFQDCDSMTKVILEEGIKIIGNSAFNSCDYLRSIHFPASVTDIGNGEFNHINGQITIAENNPYYCAIDNVVYNKTKDTLVYVPTFCTQADYAVKSGVEKIDKHAFYCCDNIKTVTLPKSVKSISHYVFTASSIRSVIMTENVSFIDDNAFMGREHDIRIYAPYNSYAWNYAKSKGIEVRESN